MKKVIIALLVLISINVNAAVGDGSVGVNAVGDGSVGVNAVGTGNNGVNAVGITQLGNGYIQVCTADAQMNVSCIITKG